MGPEMNFKTMEVQAYRKVLSTLKLKPVEGMTKTILVKQGLVGNTMARYCLPKKGTSQVIQDTHLTYIHIGSDGIYNKHRSLSGCRDYILQSKGSRPNVQAAYKNTNYRRMFKLIIAFTHGRRERSRR